MVLLRTSQASVAGRPIGSASTPTLVAWPRVEKEDDVELLIAWQRGDKAAGSALFKRHFSALYRFFANKLPDEAEDLVQATWMACVRYTDSVSKAATFRAYLFAIARNQLFRALRARVPDQNVDFGVSAIVDLAASPATAAATAERDRALLGALRALPVDSQIVLELHYWEDLSGTELAGVLELPVGTAKTRLRRAKTLLQQALRRGKQAPADDALDAWVRSMRGKLPAET